VEPFSIAKRKALLPMAKASLRLADHFVGAYVPNLKKMLLYEDKTLGLCPKPYHLLKKVDENFSISFAAYA
jgi:hypothetical protein